MSLFIGNSSQYSYVQADPEKIKVAEIQYQAMQHTFNNVLQKCREKCIPSEYGENELNTGEMCCVDRCVSKFVKANAVMGTYLQNQGFSPNYHMPEYQQIKGKLQ